MALGVPSGALLTYEDLRELPDDGRRYELIDGALVVTPAPGGPHQIVVGSLYRLLWEARPPGATVLVAPIDFVPRPDSALQPDVVVVEGEEASRARLTRPPQLVVEVISPTSRSIDLGAKRYSYANAGVPHYWVVDPEPPVELIAFELSGPTYVEAARVHGTDSFHASTPFPVSVVPANLREV